MLLLIIANISILFYAKRRLLEPSDVCALKRLRKILWGTWIAASLAVVAEISIAYADLTHLPEDEKVPALGDSLSTLGAWEVVPFIATLGSLVWLVWRSKKKSPQ